MDINSIFGWDRGANKEAADYAQQNGGQISLNPIQRLFGADDTDVQNILDRRQQEALNRTYGGALALAGKGGAMWGENESSVQGRIAAGQRSIKAQDEANAHSRTMAPLTAQLEASTTESRLNRESQADQYRTTLQAQESRLAHTDKQNRLDRGLERELSGNRDDLNMQIAMMNNELSEKRMAYDRETRSMDRRDKMIAQLMSGLGQLGGAFAL